MVVNLKYMLCSRRREGVSSTLHAGVRPGGPVEEKMLAYARPGYGGSVGLRSRLPSRARLHVLLPTKTSLLCTQSLGKC